jgi:hypothetical protein
MLALTMDQNARRLLSRVGDIAQLRETATRRLEKFHNRYASGEPAQSADLVDIRNAARNAAAERDQFVAVSDLVNAFPNENGRLVYGTSDDSRALALMEKIESGLVPRVSNAMATIEVLVQDALQEQKQTVQRLLADLSAKRTWDEEQQRLFMDDIRRQVRAAVEGEINAVLNDFNAKVDAKLAALDVADREPEAEAEHEVLVTSPVAPTKRSYWSWMIL